MGRRGGILRAGAVASIANRASIRVRAAPQRSGGFAFHRSRAHGEFAEVERHQTSGVANFNQQSAAFRATAFA
jgi:hypothetical protein